MSPSLRPSVLPLLLLVACGTEESDPTDSTPVEEVDGVDDLDTGDTSEDGQKRLCINEFMADDAALGDPPVVTDWIEIHNPRATDVDLQGWSLTDDLGDPRRFVFPVSLVVPAGGWVVVASREGTSFTQINFQIQRTGEEIGLYDPDGRVQDAVSYHSQRDGVSYARFPDGGATWSFDETPTPEAGNGAEP